MAHYLSTSEGKSRYKIRGTTVEPTFGQLKENRKTRGFMRRGKKACQAEWKLICTVHNLQKVRQHEQVLKKAALPLLLRRSSQNRPPKKATGVVRLQKLSEIKNFMKNRSKNLRYQFNKYCF